MKQVKMENIEYNPANTENKAVNKLIKVLKIAGVVSIAYLGASKCASFGYRYGIRKEFDLLTQYNPVIAEEFKAWLTVNKF